MLHSIFVCGFNICIITCTYFLISELKIDKSDHYHFTPYILVTHSQQEGYMDLVRSGSGSGSGRQLSPNVQATLKILHLVKKGGLFHILFGRIQF